MMLVKQKYHKIQQRKLMFVAFITNEYEFITKPVFRLKYTQWRVQQY